MAQQNYLGMFGMAGEEAARAAALNAQRQQAAQLAQMTPQQQVGYGRVRGGQMLGAGVGDLLRTGVGAATGVDTRNAAEVARAVREQLAAANIDPTDIDKFYPALIQILQRNGMMAEAMAATREYEDLKLKNEDRAIKRDDLERKRKADDVKGEWLRAKIASLNSSPKERILAEYAETVKKLEDPGVPPEEKTVLQRLALAQEAALGMKPTKTANGEWQVKVQQGTKTDPARIIRFNPLTGETKTTTLDGRPMEEGKEQSADRPSGDKLAPANIHEEWGDVKDQVQRLARLAGSFRESYVGGSMQKLATAVGFEDLMVKLTALGNANPGAQAWWNDYADLVTHIRHRLFGATLTGGESNAFQLIKALAGMPSQAVLARLKMQASTGLSNLKTKVKSVGSGGYNVASHYADLDALEPVVAAMPAKPGASAAPSTPAPAPTAGGQSPAGGQGEVTFVRGPDGKLVRGK